MVVYSPMTTRLKRIGYDVIALRRELAGAGERLSQALSEGIGANADPMRHGFYDVDLDGVRYYIHLHEAGNTAYIVALIRHGAERFCCPELVGAARAS